MDFAASLDVVETGRLHERGPAAGDVVQALLVLLQRNAPEDDVGIRRPEAHGGEREDGEADEHLDEGEAAASHLGVMGGIGAQVIGSIGMTVRFSLRVTSRRTRSHVPSG